MKTDLFIVSCLKHRHWLEYCLASITKFARGFERVVVLVPDTEGPAFSELCLKHNAHLRVGREPAGKGHLWQCLQKCRADEHCAGADFVMHLDSDCIFRQPVTPEDFFQDGKPVLLIEEYASLEKQFPGFPWRPVVEATLGRPVRYETMRAPGMVNPIGIYADVRQAVVRAQDEPFDDYVLSCQNQFPQTFCEFNTIGAIALEEPWVHRYEVRDVVGDGWPAQKIIQGWSHATLDQPVSISLDGKATTTTGRELFGKILNHETHP